jgi:hypothetical protein
MRHDGLRPPVGTLTMLALVVLVEGCATVRPVVQPKPWDRQADSGPLQVFAADPSSPGQQLFQALLREPSLEALFKREGQPDTLEVVGGRWQPKQILLIYARRGAGRPRRIVLDSVNDGFVARAPELIATPRRPARRGRVRAKSTKIREPAAVGENEPGGVPTAQQQLECPIDATRSDCRALCRPRGTYEWCR